MASVRTFLVVLSVCLVGASAQFFNFPKRCAQLTTPLDKNAPVQPFTTKGRYFGTYGTSSGNFFLRGSGAMGALNADGQPDWTYRPSKAFGGQPYLGPYVLGVTPEDNPVVIFAPYNVPSDDPVILQVRNVVSGEKVVDARFPLINKSTRYTSFGVSVDGKYGFMLRGTNLTVVPTDGGSPHNIDLTGMLTATTQLNWPMQSVKQSDGKYILMWTVTSSLKLTAITVSVDGNGGASPAWDGPALPTTPLNWEFDASGSTLFSVGQQSYSPSKCWYQAVSVASGNKLWSKTVASNKGSCSQIILDPTTGFLLAAHDSMALTALSPSDGSEVWSASVNSQWSPSFGPNADIQPACKIDFNDPPSPNTAKPYIVYSPALDTIGAIHPMFVYLIEPYGGTMEYWWTTPRDWQPGKTYYKHVAANSGGAAVYMQTENNATVTNYFVPFRRFCSGQPSSGNYCS